MTVKDNKKAHISDALVGDEIQALQSANADQHRDRITRFGILKHRAKQQENFLWTLAKFKENYPNGHNYRYDIPMKLVSRVESGRKVLWENPCFEGDRK